MHTPRFQALVVALLAALLVVALFILVGVAYLVYGLIQFQNAVAELGTLFSA